jgi:hypothetical protein
MSTCPGQKKIIFNLMKPFVIGEKKELIAKEINNHPTAMKLFGTR